MQRRRISALVMWIAALYLVTAPLDGAGQLLHTERRGPRRVRHRETYAAFDETFPITIGFYEPERRHPDNDPFAGFGHFPRLGPEFDILNFPTVPPRTFQRHIPRGDVYNNNKNNNNNNNNDKNRNFYEYVEHVYTDQYDISPSTALPDTRGFTSAATTDATDSSATTRAATDSSATTLTLAAPEGATGDNATESETAQGSEMAGNGVIETAREGGFGTAREGEFGTAGKGVREAAVTGGDSISLAFTESPAFPQLPFFGAIDDPCPGGVVMCGEYTDYTACTTTCEQGAGMQLRTRNCVCERTFDKYSLGFRLCYNRVGRGSRTGGCDLYATAELRVCSTAQQCTDSSATTAATEGADER